MKKKNNNLIIYLILGIIFLLLVLTSYLVTNNFVVPIVVFVLILSYVIIFGYKKIVKHNEKLRRIEECYNFSYNFTIAINIKNSVDAAYDSISDSLSLPLKEFLSTLEHVDRLTAIGHLRNYFKINAFDVYYRILLLYFEQGGNVIKMSSLVLEEMENLNARALSMRLKIRRSLINFALLWFLTLAILLLTRFLIPSFYLEMLANPIFPYLILFFFLFMLFSVHIFIVRATKDEQLGALHEEF